MAKKKSRSQTQAKKQWLLHRPPLKRKRSKNKFKRKGHFRSRTTRHVQLQVDPDGETFQWSMPHIQTPPLSSFDSVTNKQSVPDDNVQRQRDFVELLSTGVNRVNGVLQCGVNGIRCFVSSLANCACTGAEQVKKVLVQNCKGTIVRPRLHHTGEFSCHYKNQWQIGRLFIH